MGYTNKNDIGDMISYKLAGFELILKKSGFFQFDKFDRDTIQK